MNKTRNTIITLVVVAILLSACAQPAAPASQNADRIIVSVSVLPQKYFVERIGAEFVDVNVMVGPGDSPHSYEPKPSQMTALSDSVLYFSVGVEFEDAWMDRITSANPEMKVIDLTQGMTRIPSMDEHDHQEDADQQETDDHSADEANHDEEVDPHIWTSPANGAVIAETITEALITADPDHADTYQANLQRLLADISTLQEDIHTALEDLDTRKFMVFHPAWGYFAREFNLEQIPIEVDGSEPSARELADLITEAKAEGIQVVFAQPEFSTRSAEYIAQEIDGKVILISPLAENWLENLRHVAETISEAL